MRTLRVPTVLLSAPPQRVRWQLPRRPSSLPRIVVGALLVSVACDPWALCALVSWICS
jgi:hypothetical protein